MMREEGMEGRMGHTGYIECEAKLEIVCSLDSVSQGEPLKVLLSIR